MTPARINPVKKIPITREISIWLERYEDIFSDFDSRPYSDRVLSDDFISEVANVCRESESGSAN